MCKGPGGKNPKQHNKKQPQRKHLVYLAVQILLQRAIISTYWRQYIFINGYFTNNTTTAILLYYQDP